MALHYILPHYTTLHYTTLSYTALDYTTLHYAKLHCTTLHYTTLHYTTLSYTTLHYTTLHYAKLHCTRLHYTTLHYTTLHEQKRTQLLQYSFPPILSKKNCKAFTKLICICKNSISFCFFFFNCVDFKTIWCKLLVFLLSQMFNSEILPANNNQYVESLIRPWYKYQTSADFSPLKPAWR